EGVATVVDGDTLRIGDERIRLLGIDAPEVQQTCSAAAKWPCGMKATQQLRLYTAGHRVSCEALSQDNYGRLVAICIADGRDLSEAMTRSGYAVATPQYSDRYVGPESAARAERRGIWAGSFQDPATYRRERR